MADLSQVNAVARIAEALHTENQRVDLLVNNAGFGYHGNFADQDAESVRSEVLVNVNALVALTHFAARHAAAWQRRRDQHCIDRCVPAHALHGPRRYAPPRHSSSRSPRLSGPSAVPARRAGGGPCPGATTTAFFDVSGGGAIGTMRTPTQVVATGLRALERGKGYAVDGIQNYILAQMPPASAPYGRDAHRRASTMVGAR